MVPYQIIAGSFSGASVVPFLGSAASAVGAEGGLALPLGAQLAQHFARLAEYPGKDPTDLLKVSQYLEEVPADRTLLRNELGRVFGTEVKQTYSSAASRFLRSLPEKLFPSLIVTTNYDLLVEQVLIDRKIPFIAVCHALRGRRTSGRLLVYDRLDSTIGEQMFMTRDEVDGLVLARRSGGARLTVVYKMHGTALGDICTFLPDWDADTYVVTENDYVDFLARDFLAQVPASVLNAIRRSRLLYLGYSLKDWNTRVLLKRIRIIQRDFGNDEMRHWACVGHAEDPVDIQFWRERKVNLYEVDLCEFMDKLLHATMGVA